MCIVCFFCANLTSSIEDKVVPPHVMKVCRYAGMLESQTHLFLFSAFGRDQWSTLRPGCFTPGKETLYPLKNLLLGRFFLTALVKCTFI